MFFTSTNAIKIASDSHHHSSSNYNDNNNTSNSNNISGGSSSSLGIQSFLKTLGGGRKSASSSPNTHADILFSAEQAELDPIDENASTDNSALSKSPTKGHRRGRSGGGLASNAAELMSTCPTRQTDLMGKEINGGGVESINDKAVRGGKFGALVITAFEDYEDDERGQSTFDLNVNNSGNNSKRNSLSNEEEKLQYENKSTKPLHSPVNEGKNDILLLPTVVDKNASYMSSGIRNIPNPYRSMRNTPPRVSA